ncbi:MAG TPA: hypothetical protein DDW85_00750, partial [Porphyromonadaceae bacterium]|nr:hypothetical protein [Porphyromonadaceae bacterium]
DKITLVHDGTEKLIVKNAQGDVTYSSENKYIASVTEDGTVTGGVKGETTIRAKSGDEVAECTVEVKTLVNYLPDPYLGFGDDVNKVETEIAKNGKVEKTTNNLGQLIEVDGEKFVYLYIFENGKMTGCGFTFRTTEKSLKNTVDYLLERYVVVSKTGAYSYAFMSADKTTAVLLSPSENNETINVVFVPYKDEQSRTALLSRFF